MRISKESKQKFWSKVKESKGCWFYVGQRGEIAKNYAGFCFREIRDSAHRFAWKITNGLIPSHLVIDHLCRCRPCVNPNHMELVTIGENVLRGNAPTALNARKTKCRKDR